MKWWIKVSGKVYGPYTLTELKELVEIERINKSSLIAESEKGPFYKAVKLKTLFTSENSEDNLVNIKGAWCPNCRYRNSVKKMGNLGCFWIVIIFISFGIGLLLFPFFPREWNCLSCGNRWRA